MENENKRGMLYLCATPIGNLEDATLRLLRILKEADLIAAEDTRQTIKLLNHFDIKTPLISYHEHNVHEKTKELIKKLQEGMIIAQVSDAGTPAISDPGAELLKAAYQNGIEVTTLPGPAALISAVVLSGLDTRRFIFEGFLPTDKKEKKEVLSRLENETRTTVFYEAPHRLKKTLKELLEATDETRHISLCKELTKRHETVLRFTLTEAVNYYNENEPKGEFVLVLEGRKTEEIIKESQEKWLELTLEAHMDIYLNQNIDKKQAMKLVAKDRGISKREVYSELLKSSNESE